MIEFSEATTFLEGRISGPSILNYAITILVPLRETSSDDSETELPPLDAPIQKRTLLPLPADARTDHPPAGCRYRVVGLMGSKAFPEIGYMLDPTVWGMGVATEALRAIVPALWEAMPRASAPAGGFDHILAKVDAENASSMRVLEKVGFVRGKLTRNEYRSAILGIRDSVAFYLARPGCEDELRYIMGDCDRGTQ